MKKLQALSVSWAAAIKSIKGIKAIKRIRAARTSAVACAPPRRLPAGGPLAQRRMQAAMTSQTMARRLALAALSKQPNTGIKPFDRGPDPLLAEDEPDDEPCEAPA